MAYTVTVTQRQVQSMLEDLNVFEIGGRGEMVDATDLKSVGRKPVLVRVQPPAPNKRSVL